MEMRFGHHDARLPVRGSAPCVSVCVCAAFKSSEVHQSLKFRILLPCNANAGVSLSAEGYHFYHCLAALNLRLVYEKTINNTNKHLGS